MHNRQINLARFDGFFVRMLPVLPVSRQKRPEAVLAVRTILELC